MKNYDVAIVGGGAAGLYLAALLAGKYVSVALIEAGERLGRKLSATGNGQGNLTNVNMSAEKYFGGNNDLVGEIVGSDYKSVLTPFYGIFTADQLGRVYPAGRQASSLTDSLRRIAENAPNIDIYLSDKVTAIERGFQVVLASGRSLGSGAVVLCSGGKAQKQFGTDGNGYALARGFGHGITALYPALVQLKTETQDIKTLKGLRADCIVCAESGEKQLKSCRGDVIFADYGVTGSAVFTVSSYVAGRDDVTLRLSFLPNVTEEAIAADVERKLLAGYGRAELLACTLNNQIGRAVLRRCPADDPRSIAETVKNFTLKVTGTLGFDNAQVTRGGVSMEGVTADLESKLCRGLYFAGEILDVDGECGGYNLHWAFSSARRVSEAILRSKSDLQN